MSDIDQLLSAISPVNDSVRAEVQKLLDCKTKPQGSLGRLEELCSRYCAARDTAEPDIPVKAMVVMAADHGVAADGVSAYPKEVTRQMLLNFAAGGAAINVLSRQVGARLLVVDMGVEQAVEAASGIRLERVGPGTRNLAREPAMSEAQAIEAIAAGARIVGELVDGGVTLIGIGEMGIANTTSASALVAALTGAEPAQVTGRGTGIDDRALDAKRAVIERALGLHRPSPERPLPALAALGGFEIAGLTGVILGAAARRMPVMLDGHITGAAALCAVRLVPGVIGYLIASHRSPEPGHGVALGEMGLEPLLDLKLRLGEGTGAALALPLVDAAIRILKEMATFASAGVSERSDH